MGAVPYVSSGTVTAHIPGRWEDGQPGSDLSCHVHRVSQRVGCSEVTAMGVCRFSVSPNPAFCGGEGGIGFPEATRWVLTSSQHWSYRIAAFGVN